MADGRPEGDPGSRDPSELGGILSRDCSGGIYAVELSAAPGRGRARQEPPDPSHRLQWRARGIAHCDERGCLRDDLGIPSGERHELCRGLHAEQNAIIQAAYHGVAVNGAEIYVTLQPCVTCAKTLINAGIVAVYFCGVYPDPLAMQMFEEAGTRLVRMM